MINYTKLESPIGKLLIARSEAGLCYIALPGLEDSFHKFISKHFPGNEVIRDNDALKEETVQLKEYFSGTRKEFSLKLDLRTAEFSRLALEKVYAVPYGQVTTYGHIARELGNSKSVRAVGGANARNPLPIVIPCHRVLASDGSLNGYAGGLEMKAALLRLEGASFTESLF